MQRYSVESRPSATSITIKNLNKITHKDKKAPIHVKGTLFILSFVFEQKETSNQVANSPGGGNCPPAGDALAVMYINIYTQQRTHNNQLRRRWTRVPLRPFPSVSYTHTAARMNHRLRAIAAAAATTVLSYSPSPSAHSRSLFFCCFFLFVFSHRLQMFLLLLVQFQRSFKSPDWNGYTAQK